MNEQAPGRGDAQMLTGSKKNMIRMTDILVLLAMLHSNADWLGKNMIDEEYVQMQAGDLLLI